MCYRIFIIMCIEVYLAVLKCVKIVKWIAVFIFAIDAAIFSTNINLAHEVLSSSN